MTQYADTTFLAATVHSSALTGKDASAQNAALTRASNLADSYLASRFKLPLTSWSDDLRTAVCQIAAYYLATSKAHGADGQRTLVRVEYDDAIKWLEGVAAMRMTPVGIVDSSAPPRSGSKMRVTTNDPRGW